jgi:hypothetical protein
MDQKIKFNDKIGVTRKARRKTDDIDNNCEYGVN